MKIQIWIHKEDASKGKLNPTDYHLQCPQPGYQNYVVASITTDEFAQLEDTDKSKNWDSDYWMVDQYNRNRPAKEQVKTKEEIPYVYGKNPDTGQVFRRRSGDYDTPREEIVPAKKSRRRGSERIATIDDMTTFVRTLNGGEFQQWWERAGEADKKLYTMAFEELQKLDPRNANIQND
tara:strand:+ start:41 stop:574 length:534 start_codon:yes stop_codon:yes gene_type:complete